MNIYAFSLPSMENLLKIGQTSGDIQKRVKQQCSFLFEEPVIEFERYNVNIRDYDVRKYLETKGFQKVRNEWMCVTVKEVELAVIELSSNTASIKETARVNKTSTTKDEEQCKRDLLVFLTCPIRRYVPLKFFSESSLPYGCIPIYVLYYCMLELFGYLGGFSKCFEYEYLREICDWFVKKYNCIDLVVVIKELCKKLNRYKLLSSEHDTDIFCYYEALKKSQCLYKKEGTYFGK